MTSHKENPAGSAKTHRAEIDTKAAVIDKQDDTVTGIFSQRESDDHYGRVVAVLNDRWRVIVCRDGIQWILQYRNSRPETVSSGGWRGRSYCRTKQALASVCAEHAGEIDPFAAEILNALPERI